MKKTKKGNRRYQSLVGAIFKLTSFMFLYTRPTLWGSMVPGGIPPETYGI